MTLRILAMLLSLFALAHASGPGYAERRAVAVSHCEALSPSDYQTGLFLNPEGYRSFYVQSQCLQEAAVEYRDESLCKRVRRRYALFSSSWGISETQCRKLVADGVNKDRIELEKTKKLYLTSPVRLESLRIERNGNGRDFDFIPHFPAGYPHGYDVTFEILNEGHPIVVHSNGYYLDHDSNLRIYVRQSDIRERFPGFVLNRVYKVRATVTLSIGNGGPSGYWSDSFIESVFPVAERTQTLTIGSTF